MTIAYHLWRQTPNRERPELSIIVPAYNERRRIVPTLAAIASHVCTLATTWELVVVDDCSTDDTVQLVQALGFANLRLLEQPTNAGKGAAVRAGARVAAGRYVVFVDADQSTPIEQLERLLAPLRAGRADVAIGSRAAAEGDEGDRSPVRRLLSGGLRLIVRRGLGLPVSDSQCGFKAFTRPAAEALFARQRLEGFSFDLELLFLARRLGLEVAEVGVHWIDAPGSTVRPLRDTGRFLRDVRAIRRNDERGAYAL